jgi:hypothetical protein
MSNIEKNQDRNSVEAIQKSAIKKMAQSTLSLVLNGIMEKPLLLAIEGKDIINLAAIASGEGHDAGHEALQRYQSKFQAQPAVKPSRIDVLSNCLSVVNKAMRAEILDQSPNNLKDILTKKRRATISEQSNSGFGL